ncbi:MULTISPECIES: hypothetical protein [unclassified Halomonas]|uniref:hypothetical protein n=1 Tax=unclassified Halomonas TaxID=2609666 RepID=UPI0040347277
MSRRATLIVMIAAVVVIGGVWLHLDIVPSIRWSNGNGVFYGGWQAIANAWPIMLLTGGSAMLLGVITGSLIGEAARERDYRAKTADAEAKAAEAEKTAQTATQDAQAAVSAERAELQRQQQQARELVAAAKAARAAADREAERAQTRVAELERELAHTKTRLDGARAAMQRAKRREKERQQNAMANANRDRADSGVDPGLPHWLSESE